MAWRWPWERREAAKVPEDATDRWLRDLYENAESATVWQTAAVEAAAGLWGRVLSCAEVAPAGAGALAGVTPCFLAWAGRALILRGEAVALIDVAEGEARLLPCLGHDVDGHADPGSWIYRCDVAGPSSHRSRRVPAAGVVHLRWAVNRAAPWRGLSPIREARETGRHHARATRFAGDLADPVHLTSAVVWNKDGEAARAPRPTPEQGNLIRDEHPKRNAEIRRKNLVPILPPDVDIVSPPRNALTEAEREALQDSGSGLLSACGIPPQLLSTSGEATVAREAWRLFYLSAVAPVARQVEDELRAKLHPETALGFDMLRASDQDQISRATERRARAYKALTEAGIETGEARRLAGLD